jgi:hypothetical protein
VVVVLAVVAGMKPGSSHHCPGQVLVDGVRQSMRPQRCVAASMG